MKRLALMATAALAIGAFVLTSGTGAAPPNVPHAITLTFTERGRVPLPRRSAPHKAHA